MKPALWMVLACGASWLVLVALSGGIVHPEPLVGMAGPLLIASATWILIERAARTHPERVSRLMVSTFFAKMLFFGAYVIVALAALRLEPRPFIISFTCYFVALHLTEALLLRRLFMGSGSVAGR